VEFVQAATALKESDVRQIVGILRKHGFSVQHPRQDPTQRAQPYTSEEKERIATSFAAMLPMLEQLISSEQRRLAELDLPRGLSSVDSRSNIGEWIEFVVDNFEADRSSLTIERLQREVSEQQEAAIREIGEDAEPEILTSEQQDYVVRAGLYVIFDRSMNELTFVRDRIRELDLAARLSRPDTELSILRQAFILLMTAFDAAVFDLVRIALKNDFFGLIGTFGKNDKISLSQLANHGSFDAFRDSEVEDQLKARYLKDLLFILDKLGVELANSGNSQKLIDLVELVLRRNIHVHNRGIVDERYLERDDKDSERYNIFRYTLGAVAHIDQNYWQRTNILCETAIERLCAWVETRTDNRESLASTNNNAEPT
jgi:hypothetical protein